MALFPFVPARLLPKRALNKAHHMHSGCSRYAQPDMFAAGYWQLTHCSHFAGPRRNAAYLCASSPRNVLVAKQLSGTGAVYGPSQRLNECSKASSSCS